MKSVLAYLFMFVHLFNPALHLLEGAWAGVGQERIIDRRDPFAIEIPAIESWVRKAIDGADFQIPVGVKVTRVQIWLLDPYAQTIGFSNFNASLNGVSLATLKKADANGKTITIDLTKSKDGALKGDKNVIEVRAKEADTGIVYRATFVLLTGARGLPPMRREEAQISCQEIAAQMDPNIPLSDPIIPRLNLSAPSGPIDGRDAEPLSVRVLGEAIDRPGDRLTLLVNGRVILTTPAESGPGPSGKRGRSDSQRQNNFSGAGELRLPFDQMVNLAPADHALIIEVQDRQQNRTTCAIPVRRAIAAGRVSEAGRKYAVLVGISDYGSTDRGLKSLEYADQDAREFYNWLRAGGGFLEEDIVLLTNQQATLATVREKISRFLTKATSEDLIYLFLAGHGGPDPFDPNQYYFLLHDSKIAELKETAYPMKEIGDFLSQKKGQVRLVSFIDTCHSSRITSAIPQNGSAKEDGTEVRRPGHERKGESRPSQPSAVEKRPKARATMVGQQVRPRPDQKEPLTDPQPTTPFSFDSARVFQQTGWTVITSAGANEEAQESSRWGKGHGVFTWSLLEGLREGLADLDKDCHVTAAELAQYAAEKVRRETSGEQNPRLLTGSTGNMVLASTPKCVR